MKTTISFHRLCLYIGVLLTLASCNNERRDLVEFRNKDDSYVIGLYKETAFMRVDEDDHVRRMGVRGFQRLDGKRSNSLFGFECSPEGGIYSQLEESPDHDDQLVSFDNGDWKRGRDQFFDHVAEEACKIGNEEYEKTHKP